MFSLFENELKETKNKYDKFVMSFFSCFLSEDVFLGFVLKQSITRCYLFIFLVFSLRQ